MGLLLRQAMLISGMLFSAESWHSLTNQHIETLSKVDESLVQALVNCHPKVPKEFLHLETSTIPIKYLLKSRRLNYLKNILDRNESELVNRVYREQCINPTSGDFSELVREDCDMIGIEYN